MAQETWAGGTITGGADATSMAGKPRGGYLPLEDIPNAPKTVAMPMLNYTKMPSIRYAPVQDKVDMESRASKLMQKPLPSSFEEAASMRAQSAGQGQAAMGKALQNVSTTIQHTTDLVGGVIAQFQGAAIKAKNEGDKERANLLLETASQKRNAVYQNPKIRPEDWDTHLAAIDKELASGLQGLGATPAVRDSIGAKYSAFRSGTEVSTEVNRAKYEINATSKLGESLISDGRQEDDQVKADRGVDMLHNAGIINDEQAKEEHAKNDFMGAAHVVKVAKMNPETNDDLVKEAEGALNGKPSEHFKILNTNPALIREILYDAKQKQREFKIEGVNEIKVGISDGTIKNIDDIQKVANRVNLSKETEDQMRVLLTKAQPIVTQPGDLVEARNRIAQFDVHDDPTGEKQIALSLFLDSRISKDQRGPYDAMLDEKIKSANKPGTSQQNELNTFHAQVVERQKDGRMLPPEERHDYLSGKAKTDRIAAEKDPKKIADVQRANVLTPAEQAAVWHGDRMALDLQNTADDFYKKNPDFKVGDLLRAVWHEDEEAVKNGEKNAGSTLGTATAGKATMAYGVPSKEEWSKRQEMPTRDRPPPATSYEGQTVTPHGVAPNTDLNTPTYPAAALQTRAPEIDKRLGGVLAGKSAAFVAAGKKYGVDPLLLIAIAQFETGNGSSYSARTRNNIAGIMNPKDPSKHMVYGSIEEGIDAQASLLKRGYLSKGLTSIAAIARKYSPPGAANDPNKTNSEWPDAVTRNYNKLKAALINA